jgi:mannose/cellobiose epimerase-like protein (N-acyl-D-glucosamine 2-epimerase family)
MTPSRAALPDTLERWLFETTLPFWAEHGVDAEAGGFFEGLGLDRQPVVADGKRTMVQARQVYVFSQAALLRRHPDAAALARAGRDFLLAHCRHPDGGWRFRVARDGQPMDDTRDLYAHAFVLFGLAWLFVLDGDSDIRTHADDTVAFLDRALAHPEGGYREAVHGDGTRTAGERRQNPHMHLLEAFLAWFDASGDERWLDRARTILVLFRKRFCLDDTLREYFDEALTPLPATRGAIVEPGHHYEWVWLLHRYRTLSGDDRCDAAAERLYTFAERHGVEAASGGIIDSVTAAGTRLRHSRRLWPQTEAIKAHLARLEATGDETFERRLSRQIASFYRSHLADCPTGAWHEHVSDDGRDLVPALPASSLYHMTLAAAELVRFRGC